MQPDEAIHVLSTLGLAFLLFLAGMEIELEQLRGRLLRFAAVGWILSFVLALGVTFALHALGVIINPLLIAIMLSATALGLIVPVLKDAGESHSFFGQMVIAGASIAEFSPIVLVSLFFSAQSSSLTTKLVLFAGLAVLILFLDVTVSAGSRSTRVSDAMLSLQDTSAQIRVRGSMLLLLGATVAASDFRVDAILGAFLAGVVLSVVDRDLDEQYGHFRAKLDAVGHGVLVPVFWVTTGLNFNAGALTESLTALLRVPLFLLALLLIRGLPALVYSFADRGPEGNGGGNATGHLTYLHRRGQRDRTPTRSTYGGERLGLAGRRPPFGSAVSRARACRAQALRTTSLPVRKRATVRRLHPVFHPHRSLIRALL